MPPGASLATLPPALAVSERVSLVIGVISWPTTDGHRRRAAIRNLCTVSDLVALRFIVVQSQARHATAVEAARCAVHHQYRWRQLARWYLFGHHDCCHHAIAQTDGESAGEHQLYVLLLMAVAGGAVPNRLPAACCLHR